MQAACSESPPYLVATPIGGVFVVGRDLRARRFLRLRPSYELLASISHPGNEKEKHCKIDEAVANLGKLRSRLTPQKVARLAALCVVTGGQASYTRPDGIHVVSLGHLCAE